MKKYAKLSKCRNYRFSLSRMWDNSQPHVMFICLNPSTADETEDDPTIRCCINYAKLWGYGGLYIGNLFAFRATEPKDMLAATNPIGDNNDKWLLKLSSEAALVVAAWGNAGKHMGRSQQVRQLIPNLYCLKINKSGEPAHPLYQKTNLKPVPICI